MLKQQYELHPAATIFPLMTEEEYEGLKRDIAENGQREDIVVWCGKLIDGRNRLRACEELHRQPSVAELDEDQDPWKYVISHNLHRRHLTTSQRAMVASKLATLKNGSNQHKKEGGQNCPASIDDAARTLNVSPRSVKTAKQVQQHGSESVKQAVEQGELPVSLAAKFVEKVPDKREQSKILSSGTVAVREKVAAKNDGEKTVLTRLKKGLQGLSRNEIEAIAFFLDASAECFAVLALMAELDVSEAKAASAIFDDVLSRM